MRWIDEVLDIALERPLQPLQAVEDGSKPKVEAPIDDAQDESQESYARPH